MFSLHTLSPNHQSVRLPDSHFQISNPNLNSLLPRYSLALFPCLPASLPLARPMPEAYSEDPKTPFAQLHNPKLAPKRVFFVGQQPNILFLQFKQENR